MKLDPNIVVALITALAGPVSVLLVKRLIEDKADDAAAAGEEPDADPATVSQVVLDWARRLNSRVTAMDEELGSLKREVAALQRENTLLRRHNQLLSSQVVDLGGKPWEIPT